MCLRGGSSSSCRLAALRFFFFPCPLRALCLRQVPAFDPVIDIAVADCTQRLVIKAHLTKSFTQLLGELMQRLQVISRRGNLSLRGLKELLVALVDQARDLSIHQITWLRKDADNAVLGPLDGRGAVVLLQEDAVLRARRVQNVESVLAKPAQGVFVRARLGFFGHDSPIAGLITGAFLLLPQNVNRYCRTSGALGATLPWCSER